MPHSAVTSLPVSVPSVASFPARLRSVDGTERELVSPLIHASTFRPVPSLIIDGIKTTLSPGWLVPAGTDTTSPTGFEVPGDLGHFFSIELHFNLAWELGLPLWGALYPSGNASSPANTLSVLELLRSLL